jgi:hypothetical protein
MAPTWDGGVRGYSTRAFELFNQLLDLPSGHHLGHE